MNASDTHLADRSEETSSPPPCYVAAGLVQRGNGLSRVYPEVKSASVFGLPCESSTIHTWAGERWATSSSSLLARARSTADAGLSTARSFIAPFFPHAARRSSPDECRTLLLVSEAYESASTSTGTTCTTAVAACVADRLPAGVGSI